MSSTYFRLEIDRKVTYEFVRTFVTKIMTVEYTTFIERARHFMAMKTIATNHKEVFHIPIVFDIFWWRLHWVNHKVGWIAKVNIVRKWRISAFIIVEYFEATLLTFEWMFDQVQWKMQIHFCRLYACLWFGWFSCM